MEMKHAQQNHSSAPGSPESHIVCSKKVAGPLIARLMNGSEIQEGSARPLYVFSAEKRQVRITIVREPYRRAR
jgi:hypothetical protein